LSAVSSLCPFQDEIGGFPLFGADSLKLKVIGLGAEKPAGADYHTETPAIHWFTPWKARRKLNDAGFGDILDRWQLRQPEEFGRLGGLILSLARRSTVIRLVRDVIVATVRTPRENHRSPRLLVLQIQLKLSHFMSVFEDDPDFLFN